jgi:ArsR family transcriptional regulator
MSTGSQSIGFWWSAALKVCRPSSLTFHLQNLQRAGLITQQRASRQLIYSADFDVMNGLVGYLTENCCKASGESCSNVCAPTRSPKAAKRAAKVA